MNHWPMIALAYSLTFVALALEVALLLRRRRGAERQARAWLDGDGLPTEQAGFEARPRAAGPDGRKDSGAAS